MASETPGTNMCPDDVVAGGFLHEQRAYPDQPAVIADERAPLHSGARAGGVNSASV